MFALGLVYWLYGRPLEPTLQFINDKFGKKAPAVALANSLALKAGYNYGETAELFNEQYQVPKAKLPPGKYRKITGNEATRHRHDRGVEAGGQGAGLLLLPDHAGQRHPARALGAQEFRRGHVPGRGRDRRHRRRHRRQLRRRAGLHRHERPGRGAQGRSDRPGGHDRAARRHRQRAARRAQHRPADEDRAGRPAAGDVRPQQRVPGAGDRGVLSVRLLQRGDRGVRDRDEIHDARVPADRRLHRQRLGAVDDPDVDKLPKFDINHPTREATTQRGFMPYKRDANLVRPWALPGTPGLEHRIGGLEKQDVTGNVSYDPANHEHMVRTRAAKVAGIKPAGPDMIMTGPESGDLLILGWGSTFGAIKAATLELQRAGHQRLRLPHALPQPAARSGWARC